MTTWANFLSDIRIDLKDTGATKKWSDEALYLWAKDAIKDYSIFFPLRKDSVLLSEVPGEASAFTLPADYITEVQVENPLGTFLQKREENPGTTYAAKATEYYIEGSRLYLTAAPAGGVYLTYEAMHSVPASPTDSEMAFTIPLMDEELIRIYVKAKANEQVRTQQSQLDRFKLGNGARDDNPLKPEVGSLMDDYYDKIAARIPGGVVHLYRPRGRK